MSLTGKAYSTARTYLAGIAAKHKLNGWGDPTDNFMLQKVMQGFAKANQSRDNRLPITLSRLQQLIPALSTVCSSTYENALFKAAFTMAFFGFFRVSELVGQGKGGRQGLKLSCVKLGRDLIVTLTGSKTDQLGKGAQVRLRGVDNLPGICPVQAMAEYLQIRAPVGDTMFVHYSGEPLTRYQFQAVIKKGARILGWDVTRFSSHSFRIGAATTAAANGTSAQAIMEKGRWRSAAVHKYVRRDSP